MVYGPPRPGNVRDSLADIRAAQKIVCFGPAVGILQGLAEYLA